MDPQTAVVLEWHDALNAADYDRLATLVHEDIEIGGPRGSARGVAALRDWAERSGIRLAPGRVFRRDDAVVVEQRATWRSPETGAAGEPLQIASAFLVTGGTIWQVTRYDDLAQALAAAGLDETGEVD